MNVDRLRAVQAEEREADSLRPLPDAFYREVADYIDGLREERSRAAEAADDPFGDEDVRRLTDEIETAEEVAEAIYERRVGKLVKRATLAAAGMSVDEEGLTTEEAELFADLVAQIEAHREEVFATFGRSADRPSDGAASAVADAGEDGQGTGAESPGRGDATGHGDAPGADGGAGDDGSTSEMSGDSGDSTSAASGGPGEDDEPGEGSEETGDDPPESTDGGDPDRVTLRITRDVGEVFGVDERVYDLAAEDVVTLPEPNAKPLIEREAAERLD